jgi:pilus assembly protein Flp/PilA
MPAGVLRSIQVPVMLGGGSGESKEETMVLLLVLRSLLAQPAEPEEGQGMVEYGLIIAAVAIAVIIAIFALGPRIASMFSNAGASLS